MSALANKYGCRNVTMTGSVVAAIFFIISTFSHNVNMLIFTYGIMGGGYDLYMYACMSLRKFIKYVMLCKSAVCVRMLIAVKNKVDIHLRRVRYTWIDKPKGCLVDLPLSSRVNLLGVLSHVKYC